MRISAILAATLLVSASAHGATVSLTDASVYSQDFNTLALFGTTNSILPAGWQIVETGANADGKYRAGDGSSNVGDTYSFGSNASVDRALGSIRSESLASTFGAAFTNNTGATITQLAIQYTGEEWRLGGEGRVDQLNFQYAAGTGLIGSGAFVDFVPLDFMTPNTLMVGAKNGNAAANRTLISSTITGLNIANGQSFVLQWADADVAGPDDGLAVDDFFLTPTLASTVPEPSTWTMMLLGFAGLGFAFRQTCRKVSTA
jgi:hypothetical protein